MTKRRRVQVVVAVFVALWVGSGPAIGYPMSHDPETLWIGPLVLVGSAALMAITWAVCAWVDRGD